MSVTPIKSASTSLIKMMKNIASLQTRYNSKLIGVVNAPKLRTRAIQNQFRQMGIGSRIDLEA